VVVLQFILAVIDNSVHDAQSLKDLFLGLFLGGTARKMILPLKPYPQYALSPGYFSGAIFFKVSAFVKGL
jgi:hypothetical protein